MRHHLCLTSLGSPSYAVCNSSLSHESVPCPGSECLLLLPPPPPPPTRLPPPLLAVLRAVPGTDPLPSSVMADGFLTVLLPVRGVAPPMLRPVMDPSLPPPPPPPRGPPPPGISGCPRMPYTPAPRRPRWCLARSVSSSRKGLAQIEKEDLGAIISQVLLKHSTAV